MTIDAQQIAKNTRPVPRDEGQIEAMTMEGRMKHDINVIKSSSLRFRNPSRTTTFCAILAAAAVSLTASTAYTRWNNWQLAKAAYRVELQDAYNRAELSEAIYRRQVNSNRYGYDHSTGGAFSARELLLSESELVQTIQRNRESILGTTRKVVALLEHKPFRLPLTTDERKELYSLRVDTNKG